MSVADLVTRAAGRPARVLLAGGRSALLGDAADRLNASGLTATVVGDGGLRPDGHPRQQSVASLLRTRDSNRIRDGIHALDLAADPVRFAIGLAALGDVEAVVIGPGVPAVEVARAVAWLVGSPVEAEGARSAHWLVPDSGDLVAFADCAFDAESRSEGKARLARWAAAVQERLGFPPRVVFLAGLNDPDEDGPAHRAVAALRALHPGLVAEASATLRFRGPGNVFIFPSGTAGHLAARSVRALAGARLLGPLLMVEPLAVAGVAEDADVDELVGTAALAVIAAGHAGT